MALNRALALQAFANQFTRTPDSLGFLPSSLFRRFFIEFPAFHFPERPFALHFLFQRTQGLFDIVVANEDLNDSQGLLVK